MMRMTTVLLLAGVLLAAGSSVLADSPAPLTGWRTERGIFLSWTDPAKSFTLWRGTEPGRLSVLLTVPAGQSGFHDLAAHRAGRWCYALGDARSHGDALDFPGTAPAGGMLAGLVTTCSGLARGRWAPADTQNGFVASRNAHVQFFGSYFLAPFDDAPHATRVVWKDPAGAVFADLAGPVTAKRVELPAGPAGRLLISMAIGLREALPQSGQRRVPVAPGQYTIEAFIDGAPVSLTVWYLGGESAGTAGTSGGSPAAPGRPAPAPNLALPALGEP